MCIRDRINTNSNQLLALISDVLDLSKIESGTMEYNFAECGLGRLLSDIYHNYLLDMRPDVQMCIRDSDTPAPCCRATPSIAPAISRSVIPGRHMRIARRCILPAVSQARSISSISAGSFTSRNATTARANSAEA